MADLGNVEDKTATQAKCSNVELGSIDNREEVLVEFQETTDLRRGLHQRHVQMIALAGTIGTGLFLGSGRAIAHAGPLGALLGYLFIGILVTGPVLSIAEMSALIPLSGGIVRHAEHFVDPALSFANGWNLVYSYAVSLPADLTAAAVIVNFWSEKNNGVWITVFGLLLILSNIVMIRIYGELEFGFATLKIMLIIGLNIMALVIVCGGGPDHHVYGFQFWRDPGPFVQYLGIPGNLGRFAGFWTVFDNAVYAYSGVENISLAAAETMSPRRNIPVAAKRIFWRVLIFYVLSIFMVGLIVPSNDKALLGNTGTATSSPFVLAASRSGIRAVPSVINAIVLTSAWSAGNSDVLGGSRTLYGLAHEGRAPQIFKRTSRLGIPYMAVGFFGLFLCLGYMTLSHTAAVVFGWFQDLAAVSSLVNWTIICIVYLRFYYGMKKQDISRDRLPWKAPLQPYAAWTALVSFVILLLTGGYTTFIQGHWSSETFVSSYIDIPIVFLLYIGFKASRRSKILRLADIPILKWIRIAEENPEPQPPPMTGWRRLNLLWS